MNQAQTALEILRLALEIGQDVADGIRALLREKRPELLPPPPERADGRVSDEDQQRIDDAFRPSER